MAAPAYPAAGPGPRLRWKRTTVTDLAVQYGVAGEGLPVLLLHGWALGHHSYKAVAARIAEQGCQVWVPSLPGFGGTGDLPGAEITLAGYARFAAGFLRAVEVTEPVVVVGHSFGGGVAVRLAHDHPERVRSLVLVNSIGGSSWRHGSVVTSIARRPLWDWGLHFPTDIWPIPQATRVLPVVLEDALPNLVRNPRSILRVARLAKGADLRPELEELKRRRLPVTVLWGARDGVIPRESFEAMCVAVGAKGEVVAGSHSWLLADPARFGEVITNDLAVARLARDLDAAGRVVRELPSLDDRPTTASP
jgi:pimeloyl-ACP methyl ester carboxylesterase